MRPARYRLRATVWLIRRIIAVLDIIADWDLRRRCPQ
jgi:hypothetical protein